MLKLSRQEGGGKRYATGDGAGQGAWSRKRVCLASAADIWAESDCNKGYDADPS